MQNVDASLIRHTVAEIQPQLISASLTLTEIRETTDDELQFIEIRYQQFVALMNLEPLFAEGQLDCM
ncbi:MAG: hypothetical protein ABSD02_18870 [Steroidobacteraceae bacterium]